MIAAGKMDRRVEIQTATNTRDAIGGPSQSWATTLTVWAEVRDLRGREIFAAQAAGSAVEKVVTIRYQPTLNAAMRLKLPGDVFAQIRHIEVVGRNEAQRIYCEVVNG